MFQFNVSIGETAGGAGYRYSRFCVCITFQDTTGRMHTRDMPMPSREEAERYVKHIQDLILRAAVAPQEELPDGIGGGFR
jgi:hypothetical protein